MSGRDAADCTDDELAAIVDAVEAAARAIPDAGPSVVSVPGEGVDEPVHWLWPGYLPYGALTIVDGDPGVSKTTLALDIAARVSCGGTMPDGERIDQQRHVLVCSGEDAIKCTLRPRLRAAEANLSAVTFLTGVHVAGQWEPLRLPDHVDLLRAEIERTGAGLVIVDPLAAFLRPGRGGIPSDSEVRTALHPLAHMAEETGAAILAVRHLTKGGAGSPAIYRGQGSIAIVGAARVGWTVAVDPDDTDPDVNARRRVVAVCKSNLSRSPRALAYTLHSVTLPSGADVARLMWHGSTDHTADSILRVPSIDRGPTAEDRARDAILEALAYGELSANDLERDARAMSGVGRNVFEAARAALRSEGAVVCRRDGLGAAGGWIWSLPLSTRGQGDKGTLGNPTNLSMSPTPLPMVVPRGDRGANGVTPPPDDSPDPRAPGYRIDGPAPTLFDPELVNPDRRRGEI